MSTIEESLTAALAHHQAGRLNEAEQFYQEVLAAEPNHANALHLMGVIASKLQRYKEAVQYFERALHLNPDDPVAQYNLGNAFRDQEKLDQAIEYYRRALALQPAYADAHNNLGMALKDQGRVDEAIASFRRALDANPGLLSAQRNLLYTVWFSPSYDLARISEVHQQWYSQSVKPLVGHIPPHANDATPDR
jgi:protein O-GlcNAc transferase